MTVTSSGASSAIEPDDQRDRMEDPSGALTVLMALLVVVGSAAGMIVSATSAAYALQLSGLPDPGAWTTYGLPTVTAIGQISAAVGFGCAVFAAFFVPPQSNGAFDVGGYRAIRWAGWAMTVWAVCALLLIPLTISNLSGTPVLDLLAPSGWGDLTKAYPQVAECRYWLWTAIFALLAAVIARVTLKWGWSFVVIALAFLSLMPSALAGHSSSGGAHDIATNSLIIHIVAAAVWLGGLVAVLAYAFGNGRWRTLAIRRYSRVAFWCLFVVGISGVINALVRMSFPELFTTTYGVIVLAKVGAIVLAGAIGGLHRRFTIRELEETDDPKASLFVRFAAIETVVFAVAFGLGAGLSRTPPPSIAVSFPSEMALKIGYDLDGPPTLERIFFDWRFDLIFGTAAIIAAVVYLRGVYRLHKRGDAWPVGRTVAWLLGCAALLFATSSGLGKYAPAMFSVHMMSHMMMSMLVPVLLVLGGPVTLALRAIPPAGRGNPPGPREWISDAIHSRFSTFITNPAIVVVLFVGSFYVLYLGGLFDIVVEHHSAHLLMNIHFLLSGYLFYWLVVGIDPSPRQLGPVPKLGIVWGALPFHAFFGVALMMTTAVIAEKWYRSLQHPWAFDLASDQRTGGGIAWATGEFPLVVVMLALLIQWQRQDTRAAKRFDRKEERDDDAELESYNAMLRQMNAPLSDTTKEEPTSDTTKDEPTSDAAKDE